MWILTLFAHVFHVEGRYLIFFFPSLVWVWVVFFFRSALPLALKTIIKKILWQLLPCSLPKGC